MRMSNGHNDAGHGEAKEHSETAWTKKQGGEISQLYKQVMARPDYNRIKSQVDAEVFPKSGELSFEQAKHNILKYIPEDLEAKIHGNKSNLVPRKATQFEYGIGLGGIATAITGLAIANPLVVIAGAAVAAYALIPKYSSTKAQEAH